jgi:GTP cyclohydrolase FolE2
LYQLVIQRLNIYSSSTQQHKNVRTQMNYERIGTDSMTEPRHITELKPDYKSAMDIRGNPTTVCPCGSEIWSLKTIFDKDDGTIELYFTDMECAECGTLATAPTPEGSTLEG